MAARAIWKGSLFIGEIPVPVKLYSAVEDRTVHFKLLHAKDKSPVQQRIVRKDGGDVVEKEAYRKAFPLGDGEAVILQPDELAALEPEPSRDITLCRFIPPRELGDAWFDRPYWLGPDGDDDAYFALAQALADRERVGIARWVMRRRRYVGALTVQGPYLSMITLRRAEQVLSLPAIQPDKSRTPTESELTLAGQLVESISGDFEPEQWPDEHRERLTRLIEAKVHGHKVTALMPKRRKASADLSDSLRASIAAARERRVA
jgi:DNA end-binding protein Ku